MDRLKTYFNKPWNPEMMNAVAPVPENVHQHLWMVYVLLFGTSLLSCLGAYWHLKYDIGGWTSTVTFVSIILLHFWVHQNREILRSMLMLVAAFYLGISIGPLLNYIVIVDQRDLYRVFVGISAFFFSYVATAEYGQPEYGQRRDVIYGLAGLFAKISVPTWMVLSKYYEEIRLPFFFQGAVQMLCNPIVYIHTLFGKVIWFQIIIQAAWFYFIRLEYGINLSDLVLPWLLVWSLNRYMVAYSQELIYLAVNGVNENSNVTRTYAFFTNLPAITISAIRHKVSSTVNRIWGYLRRDQ